MKLTTFCGKQNIENAVCLTNAVSFLPSYIYEMNFQGGGFFFINSMLHYRASVILHVWLGHLHRNWKLI